MKKSFLRTIALFLSLLTLLAFVGCAKNPDPEPNVGRDDVEQTAKKLFSERWKEITKGDMMPVEITVNYAPGKPDPSKMFASDKQYTIEVCGYLWSKESKQKFFDVCKTLDISKFKAGRAAYLSSDAVTKYYNISFNYGVDQVENKKGWYAPKLYIDCDGEVTIYVFDEGNNVYFLHSTGLNYDDFEQFTEINERRGET